MDWMWPILGGAVATVIVSFWGWLAVQVVTQGRKLVELESRIKSQSNYCEERLHWLRNLEGKLDTVAQDTAAIRVALGETPHA